MERNSCELHTSFFLDEVEADADDDVEGESNEAEEADSVFLMRSLQDSLYLEK